MWVYILEEGEKELKVYLESAYFLSTSVRKGFASFVSKLILI